jgi:hypothetical protein
VTYVIGILLLVFDAIDEDSDEELLSYFADGGNRTGHIAGFLFVAVGVLFFLLFASTLWSRLRSVEPEPRILSTLAIGAGVVSAALLIGAAASLAATAFAADELSAFVVDPNSVRLTLYVGFLLLVSAVMTMSVLVVATSVLALRTSVLPTWLGWVGFAAVVLAVVEAALLPVFVIPVWAVIVSVFLIVRAPREATEAAPPA